MLRSKVMAKPFSLGLVSYCLTAVGLWLVLTAQNTVAEIDNVLSIFAVFLTGPVLIVANLLGGGTGDSTPEIVLTIGKVIVYMIYAGIVWLPIFGVLLALRHFFWKTKNASR
jgi:succinate-acetate transporter protein